MVQMGISIDSIVLTILSMVFPRENLSIVNNLWLQCVITYGTVGKFYTPVNMAICPQV